MRFIKINYFDGESIVFCLDYLALIQSDGMQTRIILTDGSDIHFQKDIDDFCTEAFSNRHGENEYQLIEIDEDNDSPKPTSRIVDETPPKSA